MMVQDQPRDWRKLCEAAAREEDPDKLLALVEQVIIQLDECDQKRRGKLRDGAAMERLAGERAARKSPIQQTLNCPLQAQAETA